MRVSAVDVTSLASACSLAYGCLSHCRLTGEVLHEEESSPSTGTRFASAAKTPGEQGCELGTVLDASSTSALTDEKPGRFVRVVGAATALLFVAVFGGKLGHLKVWNRSLTTCLLRTANPHLFACYSVRVSQPLFCNVILPVFLCALPAVCIALYFYRHCQLTPADGSGNYLSLSLMWPSHG